ncbi:MarR family transcriptional regulator [Occultella glacieicola]|uniref:MarR family transcriptional regulator n=1 Tax=Occultella glacieicola TaxID=2518684 RepID=A0ABY2E8I0_9MICO|nr:MarR family transcriptional regulator [Occultella glacieicola]TDE98792.1 MarR family transcriptional regulator [Occultella glacieicola]
MEPTIPSTGAYRHQDDDLVVAMLEALRVFRSSDQELRQRVSASMRMNVRDLQALQFVISAQNRDELATPRGVAAHLHISTASTTKLLDRLTRSGHLERAPHPTDRRSLLISATQHAHEEVRERLAPMHARMAEIARDVPSHARPAVVQFLRRMAAQLDHAGEIAPLRPDPDLDQDVATAPHTDPEADADPRRTT